MGPGAFRPFTPNLGSVEIPAFAPYLLERQESALSREVADREIAHELRRVEVLGAELAVAPI